MDFNDDGRIVKSNFQCLINAGSSTDISVVWTQLFLIRMDSGYTLKNFHGVATVCKTNTPSNTSFRGFGGPEGAIVIENVMERIAHVLDKEPNTVKEANLTLSEDRPHYGATVFKECNVKACWEECKKQAKYSEKVKEIEAFNKADSNGVIKRGVTMTPMKFSVTMGLKFANQAGAFVNIYGDGSVYVSHGGIEMGQGLHTKMIQVASRALGIPHELIHIVETSSEIVPNASPSGGSVGADFNGAAIIEACKTLNQRLEPFKAENRTWEETIMAAYMERVNLSATGQWIKKHHF